MSDHTPFGFGKFIPGFDFLQNLSKAGQSSAGMPPMSHWVAPTVSIEEISKRIEELKAVQFWLEQNSRALAATVQALEVQKMTLSTLQGMNVSMADLAKTFTGKAADPAATAEAKGNADWPMSSAAAKTTKSEAPSARAERTTAESDAKATAQPEAPQAAEATAVPGAAASGLGDPMLWWGALSQQFQQIASTAMQDPAQQQAMAKATHMATDFTKAAMNAASSMVRQASEGVKAASTAAAKTTAKTAKAAAPATASGAKPAAASRQTSAQPAAKAAAAVKKAPAAKKTAPKAAARTVAPKAVAKPATPARKRSR
ncbi:MAG: hypothetical protein RR100_00785 [Comamonas sp.]